MESLRSAVPPWLSERVQQVLHSPAALAIQAHTQEQLQRWAQPALAEFDAALSSLRPWQIVALTALALLVALRLWALASSIVDSVRQRGVLGSIVAFLRTLPGLSGMVQKEMDKLRNDLLAARGVPPASVRVRLPDQGTAPADVLQELRQRQEHDTKVGAVAWGHARTRTLASRRSAYAAAPARLSSFLSPAVPTARAKDMTRWSHAAR